VRGKMEIEGQDCIIWDYRSVEGGLYDCALDEKCCYYHEETPFMSLKFFQLAHGSPEQRL